MIVVVQAVDSNRALATSRSSGGSSVFRYAPEAARKVMSAAETTTDTSRSWTKVSTPSANAVGIVSSAANRTRSIAISTGRLRRNSTHGPSGTATAAPTAAPAEESAATSAGPACSTWTAISGNAPNASHVPSTLVPYAPQSHPNRRPRRRPLLMPLCPHVRCCPPLQPIRDRKHQSEHHDQGSNNRMTVGHNPWLWP